MYYQQTPISGGPDPIPEDVRKKIEGHTPGPWRIVGGIKGNNLACWIFANDGESNPARELQVFSLTDSHIIKDHLKRRFADMNLIAQAPTMLATIQAQEERIRVLEEALEPFAEMFEQSEGKIRPDGHVLATMDISYLEEAYQALTPKTNKP